MKKVREGILHSSLILDAVKDSFLKLHPGVQCRNPVMFVTYLGAIFVTILLFTSQPAELWSFNLQITLWLWFTVLFANFASAIAESRGKAQAASFRKTQRETFAKLLVHGKEEKIRLATELKKGDKIVCDSGDIIPADGEVIEGIATVDESAITGESAPVIRESGGDRSAVTAGTRVVSDRIVIASLRNVAIVF